MKIEQVTDIINTKNITTHTELQVEIGDNLISAVPADDVIETEIANQDNTGYIVLEDIALYYTLGE